MRCRYVKEDGERFFLPECWGGAINGPSGCYCPTKRDDLYETVEKLSKRVAELEKVIRKQKNLFGASDEKENEQRRA